MTDEGRAAEREPVSGPGTRDSGRAAHGGSDRAADGAVPGASGAAAESGAELITGAEPVIGESHASGNTSGDVPSRVSGDVALAAAEVRSAGTRERNIDLIPPLPIPADTANLRLGPELHPACLALLPLVGVWRGTGMYGNEPTDGPPQFGQQIVISHDGRPFLRHESIAWNLDADGWVTGPAAREVGWWRPQPDGSIELLIAHAEGRIEVFYGRPRSVASWGLSTDGVWRTASAAPVIGATRLYGVTPDGRLAYVEERAHEDVELAPHAAAALERLAG